MTKVERVKFLRLFKSVALLSIVIMVSAFAGALTAYILTDNRRQLDYQSCHSWLYFSGDVILVVLTLGMLYIAHNLTKAMKVQN